jgi:hypothetical protein
MSEDLQKVDDIPMFKEVISLSRVRLASTRGHVIIVEPGVPTRIPQALFIEAAKAGCAEYSSEMAKVFQQAFDGSEELKQEIKKEEIAADPDLTRLSELVRNAVQHVIQASAANPDLVTSNGQPRIPAVRAAFDAICASEGVDVELTINAEVVRDAMADIGALSSTAEYDTSKEGDRYPSELLSDDEVGGDLDAMLDRVADLEE